MNRLLIIPGSFNPITNAHINMALAAKQAVNADKIYFIPAHDSYVARKKTLIPGYCRTWLINSMSICNNYNIQALNIETTSLFPHKTYNTITQLKIQEESKYKLNEYFICLGMDNISTLTTWYNWENFIKEYYFVACIRDNQNLNNALQKANLSEYSDRFIEIKIPENKTSSTLVRKLCEEGKFDQVKKMVPANVYEYLIRFYDEINRI